MQQMSANWLTDMTAPSRIVEAKVEVYRDSALVYTFLPEDYLSSVKIERTTENGAMFGYTLCQKASLEVIDVDGAFVLEKDDEIRIFLGTETELAKNPIFYIEEITRDEVKKNISIVAYDVINKSTKSYFKDLTITYPITIAEYADLVATYLVGTAAIWKCTIAPLDVSFVEATPPNFGGNENLRQVLTAIAEATGTICYVDSENQICFKQLRGDSVLDITQEDYFEFKLGEALPLAKVSLTNELGDSSVTMGNEDAIGYHYIMRNNPFVGADSADPADMLNHIVNCFIGQTIYAYELKWRGNPALEIGDKVTVFQNDESSIDIFYLGETLTYTGGLLATSNWAPGEEESAEAPPTTIGAALNQTFAKVDKINNEITLQAREIADNTDSVSTLFQRADSITASVEEITQNYEAVSGEVQNLSERVSTTMTKDDFSIEITNALSNGVSSVTTSTGFTFNEEGLTVKKTGEDGTVDNITTQITEDGMRVSRDDEVVLTANNEGVQAEDLHATTYLIIGNETRFEKFTDENGETRVGCFWIGG